MKSLDVRVALSEACPMCRVPAGQPCRDAPDLYPMGARLYHLTRLVYALDQLRERHAREVS